MFIHEEGKDPIPMTLTIVRIISVGWVQVLKKNCGVQIHVFYKMDDSLVPSLVNVLKTLLILRLSSIFWATNSKVNGFELYQVVDFGFTV